MLGQAWLTPSAMTGGLLMGGALLVFVGILMYTARVFLHAPVGARPGYYQWERGLLIGGFLVGVLGLGALSSVLRAAGDSLLAEAGLTGGVIGTVFLTVVEVAWVTSAGWPDRLTGTLLRLAVVLLFLSHILLGASLLQTGLLPGWAGWTTLIWNIGWLLAMARARDPYYPFMHLELPLLAGLGLLLQR
jgi:hypothetical protein